jgi:hypothetical protein
MYSQLMNSREARSLSQGSVQKDCYVRDLRNY